MGGNHLNLYQLLIALCANGQNQKTNDYQLLSTEEFKFIRFNFVLGSLIEVQGDSMIKTFENHNNKQGNIQKVQNCIETSWSWIYEIERDEYEIREGQTLLEDIFKYIDSPSDKEQLVKIFMSELLVEIDKPNQKIKEVTFIDSKIKSIMTYQKYFQRESLEIERRERERQAQEDLQDRLSLNTSRISKISIGNRSCLIQELEKGINKDEQINEQSMVVNDQQQDEFEDGEFNDEEGKA